MTPILEIWTHLNSISVKTNHFSTLLVTLGTRHIFIFMLSCLLKVIIIFPMKMFYLFFNFYAHLFSNSNANSLFSSLSTPNNVQCSCIEQAACSFFFSYLLFFILLFIYPIHLLLGSHKNCYDYFKFNVNEVCVYVNVCYLSSIYKHTHSDAYVIRIRPFPLVARLFLFQLCLHKWTCASYSHTHTLNHIHPNTHAFDSPHSVISFEFTCCGRWMCLFFNLFY